MNAFRAELESRQPADATGRRWVFVAYDQLSDAIGPLATESPDELGIVLVECPQKAGRRPYHKQKLALVLSNMRHFAVEQAARGVAVRYEVAGNGEDYAAVLGRLAVEFGPMRMQRAAERELRLELAGLIDSGALVEVAHEGWLTTSDDFAAIKGPPWRMDAFYRQVRRRTGVLMEKGKPVGGKFSFDADNRRPWRGEPAAPDEPTFELDDITREVVELVSERYPDHPGELRLEHLPATKEHAEQLWQWALRDCMPQFGPFEDAMSTKSSGIFHTRVSMMLNLHRVLPQRVVDDVVAADIPFNSKEGFVRQVLGWREFVRHVHEATDGFREVGGEAIDDNTLRATMDLPPVFWGNAPSGLACLDNVVDDVWREAYSHHITRLMVLGNLATLLGVEPRQVSTWFWVAYADAYDWVVEPNVMAMATYGVGDLMTTKPYVAGSAYINKMSDYCRGCAFDPKKTCPITRLYWQFLARNEQRLAGNQRIAMPLRSLAKRAEVQRAIDEKTAAIVTKRLAAGRQLTPEDF